MEAALHTALAAHPDDDFPLLARAATEQLITLGQWPVTPDPLTGVSPLTPRRPSTASGARSPPPDRSPRTPHHQGRHDRSWRPWSLFTQR